MVDSIAGRGCERDCGGVTPTGQVCMYPFGCRVRSGTAIWPSRPTVGTGSKGFAFVADSVRMAAMKTLTKTILTTIIAGSALLFLAACGEKEPATASEAAAEAATQVDAAADSDEAKKAQAEAEKAAEEAKKAVEDASK